MKQLLFALCSLFGITAQAQITSTQIYGDNEGIFSPSTNSLKLLSSELTHSFIIKDGNLVFSPVDSSDFYESFIHPVNVPSVFGEPSLTSNNGLQKSMFDLSTYDGNLQVNNINIVNGLVEPLTSKLISLNNKDYIKPVSSLTVNNGITLVGTTPQRLSLTADEIEDQHDIDIQSFYRSSDYSLWAQQKSTFGQNGSTVFTLFTNSSEYPDNKNGIISISSGSGNDLLFKTNNTGAYVGWSNNEGLLTIGASIINTTASFFTTGKIISEQGVSVLDQTGGVLIENQTQSEAGMASLILKQNGYINLLGTYPSNGTFSIDAYNPSGILINTSSIDWGGNASIRFATDGNEMARVTRNNFLIGTQNEDPSAIFAIASTRQGFLPPRMKNKQKESIQNPSEGLMVYDIDYKKLSFYNGSKWEIVCSK